MPYHSYLFGLIKRVECDRCGKRESPHYMWMALCKSCFTRDPREFREESFRDSWESRTGRFACCALCQCEGLPQSFCYSCTGCRSRHPDGTHIGGWGYAPNHEREVQVEHCFACHGVLVKSRNAGVTSRTYWRVGSKNGEATGSVCLQNGTHFDQVQRSCEHEYVELYSNAKTSIEAARVRSELASNPLVVRIMSSDMAGLAHNLSYASEGSTHFWCWRCGYYLNLNPSRYSLLPKVGVWTGVA